MPTLTHDELCKIAERDFYGNIGAATAATDAAHARGIINDPVSSAPQPDRLSLPSTPEPPSFRAITGESTTPVSAPPPKRLADLTIPHGVKRVILEF